MFASLSDRKLLAQLVLFLRNNSEVVEAARRYRRRANVRKQIDRATVSNPMNESDGSGDIESVYNNMLEEVAQLRNDKLSLTGQLHEANRTIACKNSF